MSLTVEERFWSKVDRRGLDECWPWLGFHDPSGYGRFHLDRRPRLAHRVAYELAHGPIPDGMSVCHHCDNPPCCNPADLFVATQGTNVADMWRKGRAKLPAPVRGADHPRSCLSVEQRKTVRDLYTAGASQTALARRFGVGRSTIHRVVRDLSGGNRRGRNHFARLTEGDIRAIRRRLTRGEHQQDIARAYGVHPSTVSYIARGCTWRETSYAHA